MQLYPAIDLKDGKCVRLKQGEFDNMTVYSDEPYKVARYFEENGATFIHLVDLDGALKGHSVNEETIKKIVGSVTVPCELGGGIRTMEDIERVLSYGIYRVIIGTKAVKEPEFVRKAIERFGSDHIVAGVDARDGMVAIEGWGEVSGTSAVSLCNAMKEMGVGHIVYTDISKDGMLCGPNVEMTKRLTEETGLDVIASGGVSSMDDLRALNAAGIKGAIMGKAIYERRIDVAAAVKEFPVFKSEIPYSEFKLNSDGMIPVVVQEEGTGEVLMVAYMNEEAYNMTIATGKMTYYSRSRQELWIKGLTSGHYQYVSGMKLDCDNDTILAIVRQAGAACHTGAHSCFFKELTGR